MKKLSESERIQLYKMLADLMRDGLPLFESLELVQKEGLGLYKASFLKKVTIISHNLQKSSSVSNSFLGLIPDEEMSILASSEIAGDLVEGFDSVSRSVMIRKKIFGNLKKALTVPFILLLACVLVVLLYSVKVFPAFEMVIPLDDWPSLPRILYTSGLWLLNYGLILLSIALSVFSFLVYKSMPLLTGNIRNNYLDKIQPYSTYKKLQSSQFLMDISILINSGVPIADTIKKKAEMSKGWSKYHYNLMYRNLTIGLPYKDALDTGFFSKEDVFFISIYSSLNGFVEMLNEISKKSNNSTLESIDKLSSILNSLTLFIFTCIVLAIFGSTFELSGAIAGA